MGREPSVRTAGRTAVVATWLLVLGVAGRPLWAVLLLGSALLLVWASPYLLVSNRRPARDRVAAQPRPGQVPRPS
jgi:hypothetical protein